MLGRENTHLKQSAGLGVISNKQCRIWSRGHHGLGFWWEGFMEEVGLEESLEGMKDLEGGEKEPGKQRRWQGLEPMRSLAGPSGAP